MSSTPFLRPSASLAHATLIKMGVCIAAIIALTTFISYFQLIRSQRAEALTNLERYAHERAQREQAIFVLAEDNHVALKQLLEERIRAYRQQELTARFDHLFMRMPDGTVRHRPEHFDGTRMPGLFVSGGVQLDGELRSRTLAVYDVLAWNGPLLHTRFTNTYITLPEKLLVIYWPESPSWSHDAPPDSPLTSLELFTNSLPENNPRRQTAWSGIFTDTVTRSWMVSVSTPLDLDGRHVATLSHDVLLRDLMTRTINDYLPGAYNVIFRDDGLLIAHPELMKEDTASEYNILTSGEQPGAQAAEAHLASQRARLRGIFEQVKHRQAGQTVLEDEENDVYIAVARLKGPEWNFVTVLPRSVVARPAFLAARYVLELGVVALLLVLTIMYWVLKLQVSRPLQTLTLASERVTSGDFQVGLDTSRNDELGRLARAFQRMASEVQQREVALRQSNEGLEQRVEERTRELRDVHRRLVDAARHAGMAEIATNVLHNVGNVLNSVRTSAMLAKERLAEVRLEQVGKVAAMLEEHQPQLSTFLTQDERGRLVIPFLSRLGVQLRDDRRELEMLLDEIGKYTEHIGTIVKLQQGYARAPQAHESVSLAELLQDALRINATMLERHAVQVELELARLPQVMTDKHKVLMILVNLISNARYAMDDTPPEARRLRVRLEGPTEDRVRIQVSDNGMGIEPGLLTRIFQYGFTTRKEGHGFGLHSSATAAQMLGGSLVAHSDGPGRGATFTLELPFRQEA
jgi:C4-dicarboxylate-specific signal transduction histidine kinase